MIVRYVGKCAQAKNGIWFWVVVKVWEHQIIRNSYLPQQCVIRFILGLREHDKLKIKINGYDRNTSLIFISIC